MVSGSYNPNPWDKTKWYAFGDGFDLMKKSVPFAEIGKSYTDINTDINTDTTPHTPKGDEPRKRSSTPVCPDFVDQQVWSDWLAHRKAKRAPVTQTVIDGAIGEAEKAGMPLEDFLRVWCRRGTQGLEAAWLKPDERKATATRGQPQPKSFAQQEREAGWARWEQQTNRQHPDRLAYEARNGGGIVIDMQTATSQQSRIPQ